VVARAIDAEMQRTGSDHVLLDVRHLGEAAIRHHFPTIHAHCASRGLNIVSAPIPVVPAAHYSCGGVATDHRGATDVAHLFAVGEVACTGLHGANRMASNSLLECLVFARSCAAALREAPRAPLPACHAGEIIADAPPPEIAEWRLCLRDLMSRRVAIVRRDAGLAEAATALAALQATVGEALAGTTPGAELASLWHAVRLARLTVRCARRRRESRGLHYNPDCPHHGDAHPQPSRSSLRELEG